MQQQVRVVHFTGTSNPALSQLLNPYAKAASKPWSWFCHHPLRAGEVCVCVCACVCERECVYVAACVRPELDNIHCGCVWQ